MCLEPCKSTRAATRKHVRKFAKIEPSVSECYSATSGDMVAPTPRTSRAQCALREGELGFATAARRASRLLQWT